MTYSDPVALSDEELSRVLSSHAIGELHKFEANDEEPCCLFMAAFCMNEDPSGDVTFGDEDTTIWFDTTYSPQWSVERLIRELEKRGLA